MTDSTTLSATIIDRWEQQVGAHPHDPALHWQAERYTFGELGRLVDQVASWLRAQGCRPGDIVATMLPRSAEAIIAQLAIIRAGTTYLAIDPRGPAVRTSAILRDAEPVMVLDSATWRLAMDNTQRSQLWPGEEAPDAVATSSAAYLVYTSGSSGPPKGVLVEHRSLANLLLEHERHISRSPPRRPAGRECGSRMASPCRSTRRGIPCCGWSPGTSYTCSRTIFAPTSR